MVKNSKVSDKYSELTEKISGIESKTMKTDFDPVKHTNETRSKIANKFVMRFFIIIGGGVVAILIYNLLVYLTWGILSQSMNGLTIKEIQVDLSSALPILISAVSSPLGFVVGYYFKSEMNK